MGALVLVDAFYRSGTCGWFNRLRLLASKHLPCVGNDSGGFVDLTPKEGWLLCLKIGRFGI